MREDKKKTQSSPDNETAAEEHVKKMMDPSEPDPEEELKPEIDIFKGQADPTTAPEITDAEIPEEPLGKDTETTENASDGEPEAEKATEQEQETEVDAAVDDIVAKESDDLLAAEDKELERAFNDKKPGFKQKVKNFFVNWWQNKKARYATLGVLAALVITAAVVPTSRYFILNTAGVRASALVTVLDNSTGQPLKNVRVSIGQQNGLTDNEGKIKLERVNLGSQDLVIEKIAFASENRKITVGWGSNPLGDFKLRPVGKQYAFLVTDFLSGKPIDKVEAESGGADAISDEEGKIKLTVDIKNDDDLKVTFKGEGYREEEVTIPLGTKDEQTVKLVSARKEVFTSKRSGKYDMYKVDIDGKNEELVLAGTGSENSDMTLVPHPSNEILAYVSTRDNKRDAEGYLLSTLLMIDLSDNSTKTVTQSQRVQIVGWNNDRLVYVQIAAGTSAANPKRHRLISYNYKTGQSQEIASSNYFNDVIMVSGKLYYAPSSAYQNSGAGLYISGSDGSNKQTVLNKETWNIFRSSYDHLILSVSGEWHDFKIGDKQPGKLSGQPANLTSRVYADSPDGKHSLWVDSRDGKGVLLSYDTVSEKDKILLTKSGIKNPIRWLDNHSLIFRVQTDQEIADYAMSIDGGQAVKIRDVTDTAGIDQWYYY